MTWYTDSEPIRQAKPESHGKDAVRWRRHSVNRQLLRKMTNEL